MIIYWFFLKKKCLFKDISECRPFSKKETLFSKPYSLEILILEKSKKSGRGKQEFIHSFIHSLFLGHFQNIWHFNCYARWLKLNSVI